MIADVRSLRLMVLGAICGFVPIASIHPQTPEIASQTWQQPDLGLELAGASTPSVTPIVTGLSQYCGVLGISVTLLNETAVAVAGNPKIEGVLTVGGQTLHPTFAPSGRPPLIRAHRFAANVRYTADIPMDLSGHGTLRVGASPHLQIDFDAPACPTAPPKR